MKTQVIYFTKTGHSRKIAKRIGKELELEALDVKESPKLKNVDLLFVVGGIYGGKSDPKLLNYLDTLEGGSVKKAVLMTSCTSMKNQQDEVRKRLEGKGIEVSNDEFICKGSFLIFGWGHPNKEDLENAVKFAKGHLEDR